MTLKGFYVAKILLVDDDNTIRHLARLWLEQSNHGVVDADNGRKALEIFDDGDFDLVITDVFMPEIEGIGLIRELRRRQPDMAVLAISSAGSDAPVDYLSMARSLGANDIMEKPLRRLRFLGSVHALIN